MLQAGLLTPAFGTTVQALRAATPQFSAVRSDDQEPYFSSTRHNEEQPYFSANTQKLNVTA